LTGTHLNQSGSAAIVTLVRAGELERGGGQGGIAGGRGDAEHLVALVVLRAVVATQRGIAKEAVDVDRSVASVVGAKGLGARGTSASRCFVEVHSVGIAAGGATGDLHGLGSVRTRRRDVNAGSLGGIRVVVEVVRVAVVHLALIHGGVDLDGRAINALRPQRGQGLDRTDAVVDGVGKAADLGNVGGNQIRLAGAVGVVPGHHREGVVGLELVLDVDGLGHGLHVFVGVQKALVQEAGKTSEDISSAVRVVKNNGLEVLKASGRGVATKGLLGTRETLRVEAVEVDFGLGLLLGLFADVFQVVKAAVKIVLGKGSDAKSRDEENFEHDRHFTVD